MAERIFAILASALLAAMMLVVQVSCAAQPRYARVEPTIPAIETAATFAYLHGTEPAILIQGTDGATSVYARFRYVVPGGKSRIYCRVFEYDSTGAEVEIAYAAGVFDLSKQEIGDKIVFNEYTKEEVSGEEIRVLLYVSIRCASYPVN